MGQGGGPLGVIGGAYAGHKATSRPKGVKPGLMERGARVAVNPAGWAFGKVVGAPAKIFSKGLATAAGERKGIVPSVLRGTSSVYDVAGGLMDPLTDPAYDALGWASRKLSRSTPTPVPTSGMGPVVKQAFFDELQNIWNAINA